MPADPQCSCAIGSSRATADLVLLDDNFASIVATVREGRHIFQNIQRAFLYLIAFHIPIVVLAITAPLMGVPLVLVPIHLVWLELIAIAVGVTRQCDGCITTHIHAAKKQCAPKEEIPEALGVAIAVNAGAALCPAGPPLAALLANPDLTHQAHDIVEEVLFDDLSFVPARDGAEVHVE